MLIGGLHKVSLIDYPGQISALIFTQGCNFRCPYCHNPELVYPHLWRPALKEKQVFNFLDARVGKLDAVVVTGGEPLLQKDLEDFFARVKERGFLVKVDTNGSYPDVLRHLIEKKYLDYCAMDVKAPWPSYERAAGVPVEVEKIKESVEIIRSSGIEYEFRTTFVSPLLRGEEVLEIAHQLGTIKRFVLQKFKSAPAMVGDRNDFRPPTAEKLLGLKAELEKIIPCVIVRN